MSNWVVKDTISRLSIDFTGDQYSSSVISALERLYTVIPGPVISSSSSKLGKKLETKNI